jgi:prepilin-type N-terminal cleavage/methylation domain-containing protein
VPKIKPQKTLGSTPANTAKGNLTGFTLIELLVVIAIIGFLASASVLAFNSARIKSRDARRKADLVQISKALELYYDQYSGYPSSACPAVDYKIKNSLALEPKIKPFLSPFPQDPITPGDCYNNQYLYISDQYNNCGSGNNALATKYTIYATLEDQSSTNLNAGSATDAWLMGGAGACGSPRPNLKICSGAGCI